LQLQGDCLDEILIEAYRLIEEAGASNVGSRGANKELIGVSFRLRHPRARLSRSSHRGVPLSATGELLWYLSGSDDVEFIAAYIPAYRKEVDKDGRINGAYGPRFFSTYGLDQFQAVTNLLRRKPNTRRAVLQLYSAKDLLVDGDVPCTTTLQFFNRDGRLHLMASLRSNDAYRGLPHDVFCFTMLQEMMAIRLGLELGEYVQMIGSFHLYDTDRGHASGYVKEGHHRIAEMPPMPAGDPFDIVADLLHVETLIRSADDKVETAIAALPDFWADVMRLTQAKLAERPEELDQIRAALKHKSYEAYIDDRKDVLGRQNSRRKSGSK
jgi:thymidylate synthase